MQSMIITKFTNNLTLQTKISSILQKWEPLKQPPIPKPILTEVPMKHLEMDLVNFQVYEKWNNGFKYMLNIVDHFTKFAWIFALKSKKAEEVADRLKIIFEGWGYPDILHSDNGGEFIAQVIVELAREYRIEIRHGAPYRPNVQGACERFNQTTEKEFAKWMTETGRKDWINHINKYLLIYRNSVHTTTRHTPFELFFGRKNHHIADLPLSDERIGNED